MSRQYIELLCSLPHLANPFVHRRPPISLVQLEKRLNMLDTEDRVLLHRLGRTFYWGDIHVLDSDPEIVATAMRLVDTVEYPDLKEWLLWRMHFRSVVAALRHRHRGATSPPDYDWGFGPYRRTLERHWQHPTFRLEGRFPWLAQARQLMEADDTYALEHLLLSSVWDYYQSQVPDEEFGFPAVWLYIMKWDLVERWCSYNSERAGSEFDRLVEAGLQASMDKLRAIA